MKSRLITLILLLVPPSLHADPVPVRFPQGTIHAYLSVHDLGGKFLAIGDVVQTVHGDEVTLHATFHFKDGSVDDETTVYTQRKVFQLVSDHHRQSGPSFPKPMETLVEATGNVTIRDLADPKAEPFTKDFDLPPDTYNGLYFTIVSNVSPTAAETKISALAASGKGRLVHLSIKPDGEEAYMVDGLQRKASIFRMHIELGGVAVVIAPVIGKQPDDIRVWISSGDAPTLLRAEAQLYEGGPIWRIQLVSPSWLGRRTGSSKP